MKKMERFNDTANYSSKYLSSLQAYQFVGLRGLTVQRQGIRNRLNKMMKLRLIREYELKTPEATSGLKVYDLDFKGFQIACQYDERCGHRTLRYHGNHAPGAGVTNYRWLHHQNSSKRPA